MASLRGARGALAVAAVLVLAVSATRSVAAVPRASASALPGTVVISEIHYHPAGDELEEFIELHNTTGETVDIGGWSISGGIDVTFPAPTPVPAGGFVVASPDPTVTAAVHGVDAAASYAPGALSNGGEPLVLGHGGEVISSVTYGDGAPWPAGPDGAGPSLELRDPAADSQEASNWAPSLVDGGSPGAPNTIAAVAPPPALVINELHYHPASDVNDDEFLELHNPGLVPIDLDGWQFESGIDLVFGPGTTLAPGGHAVVSPNPNRTFSTYGVQAIGTYAGSNLSNSGESIALVDPSGAVGAWVSYLDDPPWPPAADGGGPSLELRGPDRDPGDPAMWGASLVDGGTPAAPNSLLDADLPTIAAVSDPNGVAPGAPVTVLATVDGAASVSLALKVGFEADQVLEMHDDGMHGDGAAGDGQFGVELPGQPANTLVRFRVDATASAGTTSSPGADQVMDYHGYYVRDPAVTSEVPILDWFMSDAEYEDFHTNYADTEVRFTTVLVYGDEVFDNAEVRFKGNNVRSFPKKSYKFYLPQGSTLQVSGADRAIDEFHLNADWLSADPAKVPTAWWTLERIGIDVPDVITTRLQRNGAFEGTYTLIDKFESQWRDDLGYDGPFYEGVEEIVSGAADLSPILAWQESVTQPDDDARREAILDTVDLASVMNVQAAMAMIHSYDHASKRNLLQHLDEGTGRWSVLLWDLDGSFLSAEPRILVSPYDTFPWQADQRWHIAPVYDEPDLRQMYLRRVRTIADELYADGQLEAEFLRRSAELAPEAALDLARWPGDGRVPTSDTLAMMERIERSLQVLLSRPGLLPASQTPADEDALSIGSVQSGGERTSQHVRIDNAGSTAVDISRWTIAGGMEEIPPGTVVPAGGSIFLVGDDLAFKASHEPRIIAGELDASLDAGSELVLRTAAGREVDRATS